MLAYQRADLVLGGGCGIKCPMCWPAGVGGQFLTQLSAGLWGSQSWYQRADGWGWIPWWLALRAQVVPGLALACCWVGWILIWQAAGLGLMVSEAGSWGLWLQGPGGLVPGVSPAHWWAEPVPKSLAAGPLGPGVGVFACGGQGQGLNGPEAIAYLLVGQAVS